MSDPVRRYIDLLGELVRLGDDQTTPEADRLFEELDVAYAELSVEETARIERIVSGEEAYDFG